MTPAPLFLYGTLRDPDILAAVLGRTVAVRQLIAATAPDCVAVYFPGRVYPVLLRRPGSAAPGLLLLVAPSAAAWTLNHWIREHKPQVLARETELARAARAGTARR
ncbi:gamma-glutamylcyclotransferase family protein [Devosia sp.]|uniref:gamma-glutamylcyclotransferase family protein n=1 Tax=Devosia sp. TaxID=1871048 RepID=UPI0019FB4752|nr:gamma-glutamylcyclotransferase family protein [Devosia sp.]MBE0581268.1 gamma-glutamylcyclotransferase [Devosia sp.]